MIDENSQYHENRFFRTFPLMVDGQEICIFLIVKGEFINFVRVLVSDFSGTQQLSHLKYSRISDFFNLPYCNLLYIF